ncbi:hypothetical protein [Halioxenophilus aromaticivorans]|uniref:GIY-YIG nuclease family protein n=1 Tax=Halioxenophilus aromaticivorans TaxID=1306992 RepID=A0AAV3U309_9ALTE
MVINVKAILSVSALPDKSQYDVGFLDATGTKHRFVVAAQLSGASLHYFGTARVESRVTEHRFNRVSCLNEPKTVLRKTPLKHEQALDLYNQLELHCAELNTDDLEQYAALGQVIHSTEPTH